MKSAEITSLEDALKIVQQMPGVAEAMVWTPDAQELAEYQAEGIAARPQLEVTVWKSHANPSEVKCAIQDLGLECAGDGSAIAGPCYSFVAK